MPSRRSDRKDSQSSSEKFPLSSRFHWSEVALPSEPVLQITTDGHVFLELVVLTQLQRIEDKLDHLLTLLEQSKG